MVSRDEIARNDIDLVEHKRILRDIGNHLREIDSVLLVEGARPFETVFGAEIRSLLGLEPEEAVALKLSEIIETLLREFLGLEAEYHRIPRLEKLYIPAVFIRLFGVVNDIFLAAFSYVAESQRLEIGNVGQRVFLRLEIFFNQLVDERRVGGVCERERSDSLLLIGPDIEDKEIKLNGDYSASIPKRIFTEGLTMNDMIELIVNKLNNN